MVSLTAPLFVPAPVRVPFESGLFSVIEFDNTNHASMGITWESLGGAAVSGIADYWEACGVNLQGLPKGFANLNDTGEADGFVVYGGYKCSLVGYPVEHAQEMATLNLQVREEARVERALWTGDLGNSMSFKNAVSNGAAKDHQSALVDVEQYIVDNYGSQGVIHVNRAEATRFISERLMFRDKDTGKITTALGTPVVAGAGYPLTSPMTGATGRFLVGTGPLIGQRTEIFSGTGTRGDLVDRNNNDLYGIAERSYVIGFDMDPPIAAAYTIT